MTKSFLRLWRLADPRTLTFVWDRSVSADPRNGNLFDNSPDAGSAGRELSS
jgi:hypothetical protein